MVRLKEKKNKKKKEQKDQNALYMIVSMFFSKCGSYRMYLEGDSPHQTVIIVCELK